MNSPQDNSAISSPNTARGLTLSHSLSLIRHHVNLSLPLSGLPLGLTLSSVPTLTHPPPGFPLLTLTHPLSISLVNFKSPSFRHSNFNSRSLSQASSCSLKAGISK